MQVHAVARLSLGMIWIANYTRMYIGLDSVDSIAWNVVIVDW